MDSKTAGRALAITGGLIVLCGFSAPAWSSQDAEASPAEFPKTPLQLTQSLASSSPHQSAVPQEPVEQPVETLHQSDDGVKGFDGAYDSTGSAFEGFDREQESAGQPGFSEQ